MTDCNGSVNVEYELMFAKHYQVQYSGNNDDDDEGDGDGDCDSDCDDDVSADGADNVDDEMIKNDLNLLTFNNKKQVNGQQKFFF